ncbi:MAG: HesA/MoeB/ThiF family protein [Ruminococcus sp.]|nr:HesA/MoeB/ThiF family protein [Candidatus Copronaster equi]
MKKSDIQGFDINSKSAAVIGCGGLGCNVAVHLAGAGIGKLTLVDFDSVSESNLNRQFLYSIEDTDKPKAELTAVKLKKYSPNTEITFINRKINSTEDLNEIKNCDIVFLAVDNNKTRGILQNFCNENKIPLVNGGINGFYGTAYLYIPKKSPCLGCAGLMEKETKNILSVSSTAGIIGALEVEIGIKYLLNENADIAGILHIYDNREINKLKIKPQKNCGICGVNKNV